MSDRKTIAFWCEKSGSSDETFAEFHVNLWHFSNKKREDFFEIGVMVDDPSVLSSIKVFVPFKLGYEQIGDLGSKFIEPNLAQGIFNETLAPEFAPNKRSIELNSGVGTYCGVHIFSTDNARINQSELGLQPIDGGTLLEITSAALNSLARQSNPKVRPGYFRLRLHPQISRGRPFVTYITPTDKALGSGYEAIEYIDCRLNEARTVPAAVATAASEAPHGVAKMKRVVFLAVVPVVSSVTSSHAEWHKSRLLENEIWEDYVPQGLDDGMVVYHWRKIFDAKDEKMLQGFSAFVKMQTRKADISLIFIYVGISLLLGVLGSVVASYFLSSSGGDDSVRLSFPSSIIHASEFPDSCLKNECLGGYSTGD
ncbi:hypothetical protein [uncultured Pelagimonas sp.]|uniref:hypothetical protein n=1 Tax=uncultured Pelagimonas sp. TaxID=1618102 RepID=UPI0026322850|nr:hypothetical protein [uncultured Pelagimonas sp.]